MKKPSTRKSLIMAAVSFVICVSMLAGTTWAWFTDSASTTVNDIEAGMLEVSLLNASGSDISGETIKFAKADGSSDKAYWEPGCEYSLEPITVRNDGDLALNYKIVVSGIDGTEGLKSVITWKVKANGTEITLSSYEGTLAAGASDTITLVGTMSTAADNTYMGAKASGISITVQAKQAASEYDSNGNTYDAAAEYAA